MKTCLAAAMGLMSAVASAQAVDREAAAAWTQVSYISGTTVYLDAGRRAGLRERSRVELVRGGAVIAELSVDYVSSTRAACSIASSSAAPAVGDSARFWPERPAAVAPSTDSARQAKRTARQRALRGRAGLRYVWVDPGDGRAAWSQPAVDLRADGHGLGGSPLGVVLDVRAYRQRSGATSRGSAASTRVYQGQLEWLQRNGPMRLGVGRQLSTSLSSVGIFDGLSVEYSGRHVNTGLIGGTQPDAVSFGPSTLVREYGAFVQAHNAPATAIPWAITLGGIGSYDQGNIDREYAYLQATLSARHISVFATQELDLNRGWKADIEGSATTPTSTFAMVRLAPVDALSLNVGYDNRRSVRLYRDFVDPETEFDDAFRQGGWAGLTLSAGTHLRLNADARQARGTGADATSYTGTLDVMRLTPLRLGLQLRGSGYSGSVTAGSLVSAVLQVDPWDRMHLSLGGGRRTDSRATLDAPRRALVWNEMSGDIAIGRSLFLMFSVYRERGDAGRSQQGYTALSWRF